MDTLSIGEIQALMNEVENDGKTVHLYYSTKYKLFVAYGISAYIVERGLHSVKPRYDSDQQMPMVEVDDRQLDMLRRGMEIIEDDEDEYLQLEADHYYDERDYAEWAEFLRDQYMEE